jgi:hypothetical protein
MWSQGLLNNAWQAPPPVGVPTVPPVTATIPPVTTATARGSQRLNALAWLPPTQTPMASA